jgi:F-type H+-transporting ATPase subunit b
LAALGIDLGVLLAQIVNFSLLLIVLSMVLFKPVSKMLRERTAKIEKGVADAEAADKRLAQSEADYQKRLEEARREAQAIVAQAKEAAEKERQAILAQAQADAQTLRVRANEELARERGETLAELQGQVADLAIAAAGQVLGKSVDSTAHRQLVADFLRDLEKTA